MMVAPFGASGVITRRKPGAPLPRSKPRQKDSNMPFGGGGTITESPSQVISPTPTSPPKKEEDIREGGFSIAPEDIREGGFSAVPGTLETQAVPKEFSASIAPETQPSPFTREGVIDVGRATVTPTGQVELTQPVVEPGQARVITDREEIPILTRAELGLSQAELRLQRRVIEADTTTTPKFIGASTLVAGAALGVGTVKFATGTVKETVTRGPIAGTKFAVGGIAQTFIQAPASGVALVAGVSARDPVVTGLGAAGVAAPFLIARGGVRGIKAAPKSIKTARGLISPRVRVGVVGRIGPKRAGITPAAGAFVGEVVGARVRPFAGRFISGTQKIGRLDVARTAGEVQFKGAKPKPFESVGIARGINQRISVALSRVAKTKETTATLATTRLRGERIGTIFRGRTFSRVRRTKLVEGVALFRKLPQPRKIKFVSPKGLKDPKLPPEPKTITEAPAATFSAIQKQILAEPTRITPEVQAALRDIAPTARGAAETTIVPRFPEPDVTPSLRQISGPRFEVAQAPVTLVDTTPMQGTLLLSKQKPLQRSRQRQAERQISRQVSEPAQITEQAQRQKQRTAQKQLQRQITRERVDFPITQPVGPPLPRLFPPKDTILGRPSRRLIAGPKTKGRRTPSFSALVLGIGQKRRPKKVKKFTGLELRPVITKKRLKGII